MLSAKSINDIKILLKNGCDINYQDMLGNTALHKAVMKNNYNLANALIISGSNCRIKNYKGETPIFYAKSKEMITLFIDTLGPIIFTDMNANNENFFSDAKRRKLFNYP